MKMFLDCVFYLSVMSFLGFVIGRLIPGSWVHSDSFPYRAFGFENGGKFYDRFKIKLWKGKLPDMSKIFKEIMPEKCIKGIMKSEQFLAMVRETCIAELSHSVLAVMGFACMSIWEGAGGFIISVLYMIGNIPFIMVQRYNRFRYEKTINSMKYSLFSEDRAELGQEV